MTAWTARTVFAAMVVAATYPAWRLLWLDASPTADEARQLLCGSRSGVDAEQQRPPDASIPTRP